jgi:hypothetical protein
MILRAGITWGIVAILLAILGSALAPVLPEVDGLTLAGFAFILAGVHYSAKARSDFLQSALGGGLSGVIAAVFLLLVRYVPVAFVPTPPGTPTDLITALISGLVAGIAGGLSFKVIEA